MSVLYSHNLSMSRIKIKPFNYFEDFFVRVCYNIAIQKLFD